MKPSPLTLERLEFTRVHIDANPAFMEKAAIDQTPQLAFDFNGVTFKRTAALRYPGSEADDPKHFHCEFRLVIAKDDQKKAVIPYEIDVEASALLTYLDDGLKGNERFRGVRFSAYQMLYGAIREMVCNLTARSKFGMLQLPSADFRQAAKEDAERDEERRQLKLNVSDAQEKSPLESPKQITPRKRVAKKQSPTN